MALLTKSKDSITVECDCGAVHKLFSKDGELKIKSTYQKPKEEDYGKTKREQKSKEPKAGNIFDEFFGIESDGEDDE